MTSPTERPLTQWTTWAPLIALVSLIIAWPLHPEGLVLAPLAVLLFASVFAAVHHAEVVAHRVGEPFGSLVLAVAVTVIEVALIVTLMVSGGDDTSALARDTVFAAVMITINGIVGMALMVSALRHNFAVFNNEGASWALATVLVLASVCLVVPRFTTSEPGPEYSGSQLAFAAVASLVLYGMFVFTQTVRHRDFFLPVDPHSGKPGYADDDEDGHADPPSNRAAMVSLGLLLVSLIAVVGLAKLESPAIESAVSSAGLPHAVVGVVIALVVLLPESIAAVKNAAHERVQVSLNLAYGSAMASIGLTIPTIAVASLWLDGPLQLGLEPVQMALLITSVLASILTVVPGRSKPLQGGVHLVLFATFIFMTMAP